MNKRLYRSGENKIIAGVIGGIGEYSGVDPVILRLIWVLVVVFTALVPGLIVYLLAVVIVPPKPYGEEKTSDKDSEGTKK